MIIFEGPLLKGGHNAFDDIAPNFLIIIVWF